MKWRFEQRAWGEYRLLYDQCSGPVNIVSIADWVERFPDAPQAIVNFIWYHMMKARGPIQVMPFRPLNPDDSGWQWFPISGDSETY